MHNISIIGAGNVSTRLSLALLEVGYNIKNIYNRTPENGEKLVKLLSTKGANTEFSTKIEDTFSSDIVILTLSDDAIEPLSKIIKEALLISPPKNIPIFLHTSGATDIDTLSPLREAGARCGVLYPLMTLSRSRNIDFSIVPFLIEGDNKEVESILANIIATLKTECLICNSQRRLKFHIAAVFTSNFTNYLLGLAFDITEKEFSYLLPTTIEMIRKSFLFTPSEVQTGPAVRGDIQTMEKHIKLLEELNLREPKEIYQTISNNIINKKKNV